MFKYAGGISNLKSVFNHLWARDWRVFLYRFLAELNERRYLNESESFVVLTVFLSSYIVSAWFGLIDESTRE